VSAGADDGVSGTSYRAVDGRLVLLYGLSCCLGSCVNLLAQQLTVGVLGSWAVGPWLLHWAALAIGIGAAIPVKVLFDRKLLVVAGAPRRFSDQASFGLYLMFGCLTAGVFVGAGTVGWLVLGSHDGRLIGSFCGLVISYGVKFELDRRVTFAALA
jgi:putative flippase GtrA